MAWRAGRGTVAPRLDAHPTLHWQPAPTQDYKLHLRLRLKAMADTETAAPGQPELLFVYLRPPALDAAAKGPARVFEAMKKDLNRCRERCVRLDPAGAAGTTGADAAAPGAAAGAAVGALPGSTLLHAGLQPSIAPLRLSLHPALPRVQPCWA